MNISFRNEISSHSAVLCDVRRLMFGEDEALNSTDQTILLHGEIRSSLLGNITGSWMCVAPGTGLWESVGILW